MRKPGLWLLGLPLLMGCALFERASPEELAATFVAETRSAASPTPVPPTETPVPPTATPTPVPPPTETFTPRATPTLGPIIVQDSFASNTQMWDCEYCQWRDGALVMGPWPVSGAYVQHNAVCLPCGEVRHFRMGVDVAYGSGPSERGFGLLVKWTESFMLTAEVTSWQEVNGWNFDYEKQQWEWLNGEFAGSIRAGRGVNRLEVELAPAQLAGRTTITIRVNNRNLVILYNQSSEVGVVGLTLFGHAVEVIFDNFSFEELPPYSGWQPPGEDGPNA